MDDGGDSGSSTETSAETHKSAETAVAVPAFASAAGPVDSGNRGRVKRSGGPKSKFDWMPVIVCGVLVVVVIVLLGIGFAAGRYW